MRHIVCLPAPVSLTIVAAVVFSLHTIHGVCGYVWTTYYDETHTKLPALDYSLILAALTFNMGVLILTYCAFKGSSSFSPVF